MFSASPEPPTPPLKGLGRNFPGKKTDPNDSIQTAA